MSAVSVPVPVRGKASDTYLHCSYTRCGCCEILAPLVNGLEFQNPTPEGGLDGGSQCPERNVFAIPLWERICLSSWLISTAAAANVTSHHPSQGEPCIPARTVHPSTHCAFQRSQYRAFQREPRISACIVHSSAGPELWRTPNNSICVPYSFPPAELWCGSGT